MAGGIEKYVAREEQDKAGHQRAQTTYRTGIFPHHTLLSFILTMPEVTVEKQTVFNEEFE